MHSLSVFKTELGLIAVSLICLLADLFFAKNPRRGTILANIAMIGVAFVFSNFYLMHNRLGIALRGSFTHDGLSTFFKAFFLLAGFLTLFMAREFQGRLKRGHGEFVLLILFSLTAMMFLISAADFLLFFVALETLSISLYIMTTYLVDSDAALEAGIKYLVIGALSAALFLFGLSFIYGATGSTFYAEIARSVTAKGHFTPAFLFGMTLVIASLGFKISAVPFQFWAPDVYQGAPTPVTSYLAIASKAAGFAALLRLLTGPFAPALGLLTPVLAVLAALTVIYGNLGAIPQTNIKRLLAYSSIGHAGYLLMGLAAFAYSGKQAVLVYLLAYLFSTGGAFLVLIALSSSAKSDDIRELAGLSQRSPLLAAGMMLSLFSLAGVPPLAGFFGKFYILWSVIGAGYRWLAVIGVLNVITSLYYYLKIVKVMYLDKPADPTPVCVPYDQRLMQYASMTGILVLGIFQGPFVELAEKVFLKR